MAVDAFREAGYDAHNLAGGNRGLGRATGARSSRPDGEVARRRCPRVLMAATRIPAPLPKPASPKPPTGSAAGAGRPRADRGADRGPARLDRPGRPQARRPHLRRRRRDRARARRRDRRRRARDERQGRERDQGRGRARCATRSRPSQQEASQAAEDDVADAQRAHRRARGPGEHDRLQPAHAREPSSRWSRTTSTSCATRSPISNEVDRSSRAAAAERLDNN